MGNSNIYNKQKSDRRTLTRVLLGVRMSVTCGIEVFPSAIRLIAVTVGL